MQDSRAKFASIINPQHTALLVVDVQNFFVGLPLYPPVEEVLPRLHRLVHDARSAGVTIVCIQNVIPDEMYSEVWQHHSGRTTSILAPGSERVALYPGFEPQPGDILITKPRFSAFIGTPLETVLRSRNIRTVVVAGLTTDVCVSSTARDAFQRDFYTITLRDCSAEQTQARHESGLATLASVFGIVCDSTDITATWQAQ